MQSHWWFIGALFIVVAILALRALWNKLASWFFGG